MSRVFFTSDLHFGHTNLTWGLRGMSPKDSDYIIITNWNKVVDKRDIVYILGDVTMEKYQDIPKYMEALKGNKCIIGGNHDTKRCVKEYMRLGIQVMGVLQYKGFLCTHIPIHPSQLINCRGNIHGHIHLQKSTNNNSVSMPNPLEGRYYNVNTELHKYTPVLFDDIVKEFEAYQQIENPCN